ncbi:protein vav isoform X2 [Nematostella vectensis]|uniref:protein vav isoform X2 n=1 Tax=Nematostella vectensis TaxID=45351 RepID=UPI00207786DB|nr:protein vav isoform X2 [Nematostella vectensis]
MFSKRVLELYARYACRDTIPLIFKMAASRMRTASALSSSGRDVEEWKMARDWMISIGVLPAHGRVTDPNFTLFDFAQSLRDGVLLCQVANVLHPGAVVDVGMKPQMSQFMCLKNIRNFLTACTRLFNLADGDLFDANELYDVSDFGKVVNTLSKLSHLPESLHRGFEPFPPNTNKFAAYQDEDIYSNLEEIALSRDITEEENPYDVVTIEEEGDKIYEDLCAVNYIPKPSRQSSQEEKRKYIVAEIIETEKGYVEALRMIVHNFINDPRVKNTLNAEDKELIFINIEELHKMHSKFVFKLEDACNRMDGVNISKLFLDCRDDFLKYGNYCARMPDAQVHIDELSRRDAKFKDILEECQKRANSKFTLRSLLVVPFQRVLKYPLLLSELYKQTKPTHQDKQGLEKALCALQDVATYINQVKRDDENMKTVKDIQNSLTSGVGEDLFKFGHLMKDGEVQVKSCDQQPKKRHAFLFDRALIICKTKGDTYHHKSTLFLNYYELQENVTSGPGRGKFLHGWSMRGETMEAERNSCSMFTKTADMKDKWITEIKRAMYNLLLPGVNQGEHHFDLYTFTNPTYCGVCQNLLWGLVNQGYKCVICDASCHQGCILKCPECRGNRRPNKSFTGVSPFMPRSPISLASISPERQRKVSAPPRMGTDAQVVVAIQNFHGIAPSGRSSLNMVIGDEVEVLNQNDPEWWEGLSIRTGTTGYFPRSHVTSTENADAGNKQNQLTNRHRYEQHTLKEESPGHPSPAPGEIKDTLTKYPWFAGKMDRTEAEQETMGRSDGTFLVRESANRAGEYALSVRFRNATKHIKIPYEDGTFCLTQSKVFDSIPELVAYYRENTLGVSFTGLDTTLRCGLNEDQDNRGIGWATALYPYQARNAKEISIQKNSKILILNKDGSWWKGECDGQIGYFPSNYVKE